MTKEEILEWLDKNVRGFTQKDFELFNKFYEETTKELQEENADLITRAEHTRRDGIELLNDKREQLVKAKELLKWALHSDPEHDEDFEKKWEEAEAFLKE